MPVSPATSEPHPALESHYTSLADKQAYLRQTFDKSAPHYEKIAKWGFFGTGHYYRQQALERGGLKEGMKVVDIATGTGPTARAALAIVKDPAQVFCVEPSRGMLTESRKQISCTHIQAGADHLPLRGNLFDFLTMGFALRHVEKLESAFSEYHRVLRPGGKVLILDITKPQSGLGLFFTRLYFRDIMPLLTQVLTRNKEATSLMRYYWETMDQMVQPERVLSALKKAGFQEVKREVVLGIFSEYSAVKK